MAVWLFSGFISHGLNFRMFEHNLFCFFFPKNNGNCIAEETHCTGIIFVVNIFLLSRLVPEDASC